MMPRRYAALVFVDPKKETIDELRALLTRRVIQRTSPAGPIRVWQICSSDMIDPDSHMGQHLDFVVQVLEEVMRKGVVEKLAGAQVCVQISDYQDTAFAHVELPETFVRKVGACGLPIHAMVRLLEYGSLEEQR